MSFMRQLKLWRCKMIVLCKHNISIGKNSTFGRGTVLWCPHSMTIGNNVYIGKYCTLETDIVIQDNVLIANNVGLIGKYDHDYSQIGRTIKHSDWIGDSNYQFKGKNQKIIIESDVWIGFGAIILSGVTVHRGAIVGCGSVVTKDIPPYAIAVGNPAKVIKYRFSQEEIQRHEKLLYENSNFNHNYQ